jgi:hypothetical protein
VRVRAIIWATAALMTLVSSASSALAFNPQPDPPVTVAQGIKEKVHLPIYDSITVEPGGR